MGRGPSGWQMLNNPFTAVVYCLLVLAGLVVFGVFIAAFGAVLALVVAARWGWRVVQRRRLSRR
jgi:hypothetical protein